MLSEKWGRLIHPDTGCDNPRGSKFCRRPHERQCRGAHETRDRNDQILAIPTLVRKLPVPMRRIIGDLSNTERLLIGLDLKKHP